MIPARVAPQGTSLPPIGPQLHPLEEGLYLSPGATRKAGGGVLIDVFLPVLGNLLEPQR